MDKKKLVNLVISLFDPQLDTLGNEPGKAPAQRMCGPILSLPTLPRMPIATRYIVLVSKTDEKAAKALEPQFTKVIAEAINRKVVDHTDRKRLIADIRIQTILVDYKDIWSLQKCSSDIGQVLKGRIRDIDSIKTLVVSLAGGTTAAKTALFLTCRRMLRDFPSTTMAVVKGCGFDTPHPRMEYQPVSSTRPQSIGLLAQGVGTRDPVFADALGRLETVILTSRTEKILIVGPTGAGKSELAKLIMAYMKALHGDVTEENCIHQNVAAIAPDLIESELFGHEKGGFTGAIAQHKGIFERANKGVVFLDEIGELPKHLQAKLLTVLDGVPFTRVGGSEPVESSFLLLCGTNVDLQEACERGSFRRDLFERLRAWTVEVPPITARTGDMEVALQRERGEWRTQTGVDVLFADNDAKAYFMQKVGDYRWPGNFREFHATFVHLALFARNGRITRNDIDAEFRKKEIEQRDSEDEPSVDTSDFSETARTEYDLAEVARLACALDVCRKCKTASEAGEMLFAARARMAKDKGTQFNGASSLQRLFAQFGLKAIFKHGVCTIEMRPQTTSNYRADR